MSYCLHMHPQELVDQHNTPDSLEENTSSNFTRNFLYWAVYDFGNTFYSSGLFNYIALAWFLILFQRAEFSYEQANSMFFSSMVVIGLVVAITLPIVGSHLDILQRKKFGVIVTTVFSLVFFVIMGSTRNPWLGIVSYGISIVFFNWATIYYDAMLPLVSPPGKEGKLSALAISFGFFGGAIPIVVAGLVAPIYGEPSANPAIAPLNLGVFPFLIWFIIVFFAIFTIPMLFVKEYDFNRPNPAPVAELQDKQAPPKLRENTIRALQELKDTFVSISKSNRGMLYYIVAYFIIADLANLIGVIATEYYRSLGFSAMEITVILGCGYLGILATMGPLGTIIDRYGAKMAFRAIGGMFLVGFSLFILYGTILPNKSILYLATGIVIPATAAVWVAQRQMVMELAPSPEKIGKYLGFTKFSGKLSFALGPLIWLAIFNGLFRSIESFPTRYTFSLVTLGFSLIAGFVLIETKVPNQFRDFQMKRGIISDEGA